MLFTADTNNANGKSANVNIVEAAMNVYITQMKVLCLDLNVFSLLFTVNC